MGRYSLMIYIRNTPENLNQKLAENFQASEFRCRCGKCQLTMVHEYGLHLLTLLRQLYGKPIDINSGYRCQAYNATLANSSPYSYHTRGMAWDIALPLAHKEERAHLLAFCSVVFPSMYVAPTFAHLSIKGFETKTY